MFRDKRVIKTENLINDTVIKLIQSTRFSKITVKKICDVALISKSTFYNHFIDKYDVIEKMIDNYAQTLNNDISERFRASNQHNSFMFINKMIDTMATRDSNLSILMSQQEISGLIQERFHAIFYSNASLYFKNQKLGQKFSSEFLSQMYADLALTSLLFTIKHSDNQKMLAEQSIFMSLIQSLITD